MALLVMNTERLYVVVAVTIRFPGKCMRREYCSDCYARTKALVLAMGAFCKKHGYKLPPQLFEVILLERLKLMAFFGGQ